MKNKYFRLLLIITLFTLFSGSGLSQSPWIRNWNGGVSVGIGLPKMPLSQFRNPVSILGGGFVNYRVMPSILFQLEGYGLHTFSFGTVDNSDGKLRYNLVWTSLAVMKRLRRPGRNETFLAVGFGRYRLLQQFNAKKDNISTAGISIGLVNWSLLRRVRMVTDFRWHLLFRPDPDPQVLMINFGFLL